MEEGRYNLVGIQKAAIPDRLHFVLITVGDEHINPLKRSIKHGVSGTGL